VIVPAYNEEVHLGDTLASILTQTHVPDQIVVVDDCSTDGTGAVAEAYGAQVARPKQNQGSKARAQNFPLSSLACDIVLTVDADTVLAPSYIERILEAFRNPDTVMAAGCVLPRAARTVWERGRRIEYLFGFHFHRPVQHMVGAPVVCSGCCCAFRLDDLRALGGFPERTLVEDMDLSWTFQRMGRRAEYVASAVAYVLDPKTYRFMRAQVWRWMSGFFQNVALHARYLPKEKPWLAVWVYAAILEILLVPFWYGTCLWLTWHYGWRGFAWWFDTELALVAIPVILGARHRGENVLGVLFDLPSVFVVKVLNFVFAWRAMITELVLHRHLNVYEKGH
jgi:cellulose synthase/poly-beta-1,6-N-acetylglucosamine synthase-like glycosyltransferase